MSGRKFLTALAIAMAIQAGAARAEYPDQRINVIVPFVAGGATDIIARTIAADLASQFGQPVTIENRAGGGTAVGTEAVVRSPPRRLHGAVQQRRTDDRRRLQQEAEL